STSGLRTAIPRAQACDPQHGRIAPMACSTDWRFQSSSTVLTVPLCLAGAGILLQGFSPPLCDTSPWIECRRSAESLRPLLFPPESRAVNRCLFLSPRVRCRSSEVERTPRFPERCGHRPPGRPQAAGPVPRCTPWRSLVRCAPRPSVRGEDIQKTAFEGTRLAPRSEEHTSELQSPDHLVC